MPKFKLVSSSPGCLKSLFQLPTVFILLHLHLAGVAETLKRHVSAAPLPPPPPPAVALSPPSPGSILGVGLDFSEQRWIGDKLPFKGLMHH